MTCKIKTIWLAIIALTIIAFFAVGSAYKNPARAQTAGLQFLTTWQAKSYVPPQYHGKTMPTGGSQITVAVELINRGKIVDLSNQTVTWYQNGNILGSGKGMQTLTFLAPSDGSSAVSLTIELPDYGSQLLVAAVNIPIVRPEAVIESPYLNGVFVGNSLQVKGVPYFFNVSSPSALNFAWSVNSETPSSAEDPSNLITSINSDAPPGSTIDISLTISNPGETLAAAQAETTLTLGK